VSTWPAPGKTLLARSWARWPEIPRIRHTFICTAMSMSIDTTTAQANEAP
jgi:hypothetical protein